MTSRTILLIFLLFSVFFSVPAFNKALAADFKLSGNITDNKNNPVINSTITFTDPALNKIVATTNTDFNGNYNVTVPKGTYTIDIVPPIASGLPKTTLADQSIASNTIRNFNVINPYNAGIKKRFSNNSSMYLNAALIIFVAVIFLILKKNQHKPAKK